MMAATDQRRAPVIIIGMHRSGTSACARALARLGLFTGHDLEPNAEARFFLKLNEELLRMAGARWDAPKSVRRLWQEPELLDWLAEWLDERLSGYATRLYLSKPGWWRYRDVRNYPLPWGWKDPRNTLTLPVWLRLFPQARIVQVVRHGVDVAASLQTRERMLRQRTLTSRRRREEWRVTSPRCLDLAFGFELWEQYMAAGEEMIRALPDTQCLSFRFEDWLRQPESYLHQLDAWLELGASEELIARVAGELKPERGFAYTGNQELVEFATHRYESSGWLRQYYPEPAEA